MLVLGSRLSDFTTASKTQFQHDRVRFVSVNVNAADAAKHGALPLVADARAALADLSAALAGHRVAADHDQAIAEARAEWEDAREQILHPARRAGSLLHQAEVIRVLNDALRAALRHRARRGRPARRPAQAVAQPGRRRLPLRVRLLLHGIRDRGRPGGEDGAPRPRGLRGGRRRQLPDAQPRDRHLAAGGPEDHRRPARQPRLPVHPQPAALVRQRRLRQRVPPARSRHRPADRRERDRRLRGQRAEPGRGRVRRRHRRGAGARAGPGPPGDAHLRGLRAGRAAHAACPATRGGTCRWRRSRNRPTCRPRAAPTRRRCGPGGSTTDVAHEGDDRRRRRVLERLLRPRRAEPTPSSTARPGPPPTRSSSTPRSRPTRRRGRRCWTGSSPRGRRPPRTRSPGRSSKRSG